MKNIKQIMVRTTFILIISMLMVGGLKAQSEDLTDGMTYDSIKAQQYGADQHEKICNGFSS